MAVAAVNCEKAINAQPQSTAFNARRFTAEIKNNALGIRQMGCNICKILTKVLDAEFLIFILCGAD